MKARIILSNADFSANNIGKYVALSDFTKKVLSKQTQYSEESDEAEALNIFLKQLTDDGFIGGESPLFKTFFIPGLAADHSQLLYDIAHLDGDGYPTNAMSAGESSATDANKVYRPVLDADNRIVALQRYAVSTMDATTAKEQANIDNIAFRTLNAGVANNGQQNSFSVGVYFHNHVATTYWQNSVGAFFMSNEQISDYNVLTQIFPSTAAKIAIANYNKTEKRFEGCVDGVPFTGESGSAVLYKTADSWNTTWFGPFSYSLRPELSLFMMGDFIPAEKLTALTGYIETFITAIHANI